MVTRVTKYRADSKSIPQGIVVLVNLSFYAIAIFLSTYLTTCNGYGLLPVSIIDEPNPFVTWNTWLFEFECHCSLACNKKEVGSVLTNKLGYSTFQFHQYCNPQKKYMCSCYRTNGTTRFIGDYRDFTRKGNFEFCKKCDSYESPAEGWARYVAQISCDCQGGCRELGDFSSIERQLTGPNPDNPENPETSTRTPWNNTVRHNCETSDTGSGFCDCAVKYKNWLDYLGDCNKEYYCDSSKIPQFY